MIIAIDASRAVNQFPTGTEHYSRKIIEYLAKIDSINTYRLYSPTPPPADFPSLPKNFAWKIIPFARLWTHLRLSLALLLNKPDVLFVPAHVLPLYTPSKTVITIHDLAYEIFPQAYSPLARWYNHFSDARAVKKASRILTPSQSTKNDLHKFYNAPNLKITVTHLGYDMPVTDTPTPQSIKRLQPFFLMTGRLEERKNTALAINAFRFFREQNPKQTEKLILTGKPGFGYDKVKETIAALPTAIKKDVIETGYVSDKEAIAYRQSALALLYPSLYEGFGLPLLEAMADNLPIIASDCSSIPEIVDDAAVLVSPESANELAQAMKIFATNDLSRLEVSKRGQERIKLFSWEKTARQTLDVIHSAAKDK